MSQQRTAAHFSALQAAADIPRKLVSAPWMVVHVLKHMNVLHEQSMHLNLPVIVLHMLLDGTAAVNQAVHDP
jgi:hypothetical protein